MSRPNGTELRNQPVPLAAHQSRVLNLRELVAREDTLFGAISIRHDGLPGAILAEGFEEIETISAIHFAELA